MNYLNMRFLHANIGLQINFNYLLMYSRFWQQFILNGKIFGMRVLHYLGPAQLLKNYYGLQIRMTISTITCSSENTILYETIYYTNQTGLIQRFNTLVI